MAVVAWGLSTQLQTLDGLTVSEYSEDAKGGYAYFSRAMERYPLGMLRVIDAERLFD